MDASDYHCGECRHGELPDHCEKCNEESCARIRDENERARLQPITQLAPETPQPEIPS